MILLISLPLYGQISIQNDTIVIKEVFISWGKNNSGIPGFKKETVEPAILKDYSHSTLADLLSENSLVFIKSYGTGGTATSSFRGTGSSHTQIAWNGININNPMLGQYDLSLIPAGLADDIQIYYGGASLELNSGGIGGIINLETKPVWKKEIIASVNTCLGSFGRYNSLLKLKTGNDRFQSVTKAFLQYSRNNFHYLNTLLSSEPVWETRKNNQTRQNGFIQELYFRGVNSITSARLWYQSASRNIPVPMIVQQLNPGEKQYDESLRTLLNYDLFKENRDYSFAVALISDRLNYINQPASINSRNLSRTMILKTGIEISNDQKAKIKVLVSDEMNIVNSNNYAGRKTRNTIMLSSSVQSYLNDRFGTFFLLREIIKDHTMLLPDFSAGLEFKILTGKDYSIKANFSRNSKIPNLNDMYWMPGGNPDLKNEYAYTYELSWVMNNITSSPLKTKADITLFRNLIRDMIQWHPGEFSYWIPDNIQKVNTSGIESSVGIGYLAGNLSVSLNADYSYTRAVAPDSESEVSTKQLLYIPENQLTTVLRLDYRQISSSLLTNYTGKRFITVDNSQYLPAYIINDLNLGMKIDSKKNTFNVNFIIENIFNVTYQTVAWYPLPGRSYLVKVIFKLVK